MNEARFNELSQHVQNLEDGKKDIVLSLLKDFVFLEEEVEKLRKYPRYKINPHDPSKQIKLPVHEMLKDYQAQKNDISTKILRTLQNEKFDESPLMKALARFEND